MWEGRGVVPGSTGVLRVACPWVRCRAPPEFTPPTFPIHQLLGLDLRVFDAGRAAKIVASPPPVTEPMMVL